MHELLDKFGFCDYNSLTFGLVGMTYYTAIAQAQAVLKHPIIDGVRTLVVYSIIIQLVTPAS